MPISVNKLHLFELSGGVIITSLKNIVKNEGLRGMYRGLSPTIIALLPNWAVSTTFFLQSFVASSEFVSVKEITCPTFAWRYVISCYRLFICFWRTLGLSLIDILVSRVGLLLSLWEAKGCAAVKWLVLITYKLQIFLCFVIAFC